MANPHTNRFSKTRCDEPYAILGIGKSRGNYIRDDASEAAASPLRVGLSGTVTASFARPSGIQCPHQSLALETHSPKCMGCRTLVPASQGPGRHHRIASEIDILMSSGLRISDSVRN